jgi:hypothetical protein
MPAGKVLPFQRLGFAKIFMPEHFFKLTFPGKMQGCQMVYYFQTKNPNLGKSWRILQWKILVYFMAIWSIFCPFCIFYGTLVYFVVIWYIFSVLVYCINKNLATLEKCTSWKS